MPTDISSGELTSVSAVKDGIAKCHDIVKIKSGGGYTQLFRHLRMCQGRMYGRALGTIVGSIRFEIAYSPGHNQAVHIGIIPEGADASMVPTKRSHIMATGMSLQSTSYASTSHTYEFVPGVARQLKGVTTDILAGSPPKLFFYGEAVTQHDGKEPTSFNHYIHIYYDLQVDGMDYISPFHDLYSIPVQLIPSFNNPGSSTASVRSAKVPSGPGTTKGSGT